MDISESVFNNLVSRIEKLESESLTYAALNQQLTTVLYAAPAKPREGMFAFADGTTWNPGAGRGLYNYVSGAWVKL